MLLRWGSCWTNIWVVSDLGRHDAHVVKFPHPRDPACPIKQTSRKPEIANWILFYVGKVCACCFETDKPVGHWKPTYECFHGQENWIDLETSTNNILFIQNKHRITSLTWCNLKYWGLNKIVDIWQITFSYSPSWKVLFKLGSKFLRCFLASPINNNT